MSFLWGKASFSVVASLLFLATSGVSMAVQGPFQYRDQFDSVAYNNSDGSTDWSSESWTETGDNNAPGSGDILITGNRLRFQPDGAADTIQRTLDLDTATSATLSFNWEMSGATEDCGVGGADEINVLIRAQPTDSFTQIGADICGIPQNTSGTFSESIPLSFLTANTEIQIRAEGFLGGNEFFFVDNVNVAGIAPIPNTSSFLGNVWYDLSGEGILDSGEVSIANVSLNLFPNSTCSAPAIQNTFTDVLGNYNFNVSELGNYCIQVVESSLPAIGYLSTTGGFQQSINVVSHGVFNNQNFGFEASTCLPVIDFDTFPNGTATSAGDIISNQFAPWGITVSATGGSNDAMIFDGANPTGGDVDLGSPHESFGGPGEGADGAFGLVGENRVPQRRILIISEDGDQADPDDNASGGTLTFTFDRDLHMDELLFLDFGDTIGVNAGEARFFNAAGVEISSTILPSVGDNGLGGVTLTETGIRRVEVEFFQSGSMAKFAICPAIIRESAVGDLVWLDIDADGVFDIGEPGLSNVLVSLYDAGPDGVFGGGDDFLIETTQTGSDGSYLFSNVVGSNYYVQVEESSLPSGLTLSPGTVNPQAVFTLANNSSNLEQDFPYTNDSSSNAIVGDLVWSDADSDGVRDPGEPGIAGVTLDLIDASNNMVVATTTTGADGQYLFTNVVPGEYLVEVTDTTNELTGYTLTTGPQSNPSPSDPFAVAAGDVVLTLDFGYDNDALFNITDTVWLDNDNDGVLDASENGIENVTVNLLDDNGVVIATAITDANGQFSFTGLEDGDYRLQISDANNELIDYQSTTTPAENGFFDVTINGANVSNISFGYNQRGTIGDTVWSDANSNGVQDDNEVGIAGVQVTLYFDENGNGTLQPSDTIVNITTTDVNGNYLFEDLIGVDYLVVIDADQPELAGYTQTGDPDEAGTCSTCDEESGTTLVLGGSDLEQDFGYNNPSLADISGNVFEDIDADGLDDGAGEPGFQSVTLTLSTAGADGIFGTLDDIVLATTSTDSAGDYSFPDLQDNDYRVEVTDDLDILNDYSLTSGLDIIDVTLAEVDITDVDFGYVRSSGTASIGDFVWFDTNMDGIQDNNESGIQSVTLNLFTPGADGIIGNGDDVLVATALTDIFGNYDFQGLSAGNYYVEVDTSTLPAGLTLSPSLSNPTANIVLSDGEDYNDADFGYSSQAGTSLLGDLVWADTNGNAIRDPGEVGIAGVNADLLGAGPDDIFGTADDITLSTTTGTAPDGSYLFSNLPPGMYIVTVDTSTVPAAYNSTPTNSGDTYQVTTMADDAFLSLDWGFQPNPGTTGSIGDTIWLDTDSDGIEDVGEPGIENVTVNLIGPGVDGVFGTSDDDLLATTITDSQGNYIFNGVLLGNYQVQVSDTNGVLVGNNQTSPAIGTINLSANENFNTADFGYAPGPGSIGNLVFLDANNNGIREPAEAGLQGVILNLWQDVNGNGIIDNDGTDNLLRQTLTNTNGIYSFNGLPNESYIVELDSGNFASGGVLESTIQTFGTVDTDSHGQQSPYAAELITGNNQIITADFGVIGNAAFSLSGTIFEDANDNASLNSGEPSIESALVTVYRDLNNNGVIDAADSQFGVIRTDNTGFYQFDGLPAGNYIVSSNIDNTRVAGYEQTTQTATNGLQLVSIVNMNSINNDFGYFNGGITTTAVTLAYFESQIHDQEVRVYFGTSTETGNLGFTIYQELKNGKIETRSDFIKSESVDSLQLIDYQQKFNFVNNEPLWITDTDTNGKVTIHGPFSIGQKYGFKQEQEKIDWKQINDRMKAAKRFNNLPVESVDVHVNKTGMYRVYHDQLLAMGLDLSGYESQFISLELKTPQGKVTVPRKVSDVIFETNSYIEFYGVNNEGFYTDDNVYHIAINSDVNPSIAEVAITVDDVVDNAYQKAIHSINENNEYSYISPNGDPWFHTGFRAINAASQTQFDIELDNMYDQQAQIEFKLFGVTDFPGSAQDHHLRINWNDENIIDAWDDGHADMNYSSHLNVIDPNNTLTFELPLDTGFNFDLINLESVAITYNRKLVADLSQYQFKVEWLNNDDMNDDMIFAHGFESFTGQGFYVTNVTDENFRVYAIDQNGLPTELIDIERSIDSGSAQILVPQVNDINRYIVIQNEEYLTPLLKESHHSDVLLTGAAEYLMISHPAFINDLTPLKSYHENNNISVKVVNVYDIYEQYSASRLDAQAIKSYIKDAVNVLGVKMVLLVGGDSYDYHDYLSLGSLSFIPTLYKPTSEILRYTPTDSALVDFNDDNVPDVPLGRFPVRTVDELSNLIQKTMQYAQKTYQDSILFVADNTEPDASFTSYSEDMIQALPQHWSFASAYLDNKSTDEIKNDIFNHSDSGLAMLNFFGHSGPSRWAFEGVFDANNAAAMTNFDRPTVVNQWGCWNTYFVSPFANTLAHKFLLSGTNGAAAVLGPSTLTKVASEQILGNLSLPLLMTPNMTIGQAMIQAKQTMAEDNPDNLDVLLGHSLLGDPALVISQ